MTEAEWLNCNDPAAMLEALRASAKTSPRRLRLFACAVCRPLCFDQRTRRAIDTVEGYADRAVGDDELGFFARGIAEFWRRTHAVATSRQGMLARTSYELASYAAGHDPWKAASDVARTAIWIRGNLDADLEDAKVLERGRQAALLRDIFGEVIRISPFMEWNAGTVSNLAQAIYDERSYDRLPILADALEDAGCHDEKILVHCRETEDHARGCWVLDLLLGKE